MFDSRLRLAALGLVALAACTTDTTDDGAAKVTIHYSGFHPGCVQVTATDAHDATKTASTTAQAPAGSTSGDVIIAVFRKADWSHDVTVTAALMEQSCTGAVVATDSAQVTIDVGAVERAFTLSAVDADQDGWVAKASGGTDCDDTHADTHPGAPELCDGRDNNCVNGIDEGFNVGASCTNGSGCQAQLACAADGGVLCPGGTQTWYPDGDRDGHGRADAGGTPSCTQPAGFVTLHDDCNDSDRTIFPGAPEICDGKDNDCDGTADEPWNVGGACTATGCSGQRACAPDGGALCNAPVGITVFVDADRDGHGQADGGPLISCSGVDAGFSTVADDCDDSNAAVHPGAREICNGIDDNCVNGIDEGYNVGLACSSALGCGGQLACVSDGGSACNAPVGVTAYVDADRDTYGAGAPVVLCNGGLDAGYSANNLDCDDSNPAVHPGATEICNGIDDNCVNGIDEGFKVGTACSSALGCGGQFACLTDGGSACNAPAGFVEYLDNDKDGFGSDAGAVVCAGGLDAGYVLNNSDCDDTNKAVHPGATEICNGIDDNCVNGIDEGFNVGSACNAGACMASVACAPDGGTYCPQPTWYADQDFDNHGRKDGGVQQCAQPPGYVASSDDCDDGNPYSFPGATEICDGRDNNCNGLIDEDAGCPVDAGFVKYTGAGNANLLTDSSFDAGAVWVAGASDTVASHVAGTPFAANASCFGSSKVDIHASWADTNGTVFLGAINTQTGATLAGGSSLGSGACGTLPVNLGAGAQTNVTVTGLYGYHQGNALHVLGVEDNGMAFDWNGSTTFTPLTTPAGPPTLSFDDIDGMGAGPVFAVGTDSFTNARILRFSQGSGAFSDETLPPSLQAGNHEFFAVSVASTRFAIAVGQAGTVAEWDGTSWSRFPVDVPGAPDLHGVVAYGPNEIWVLGNTAGAGTIYRWHDGAWSTVYSAAAPLNDITASSPADVWVVGNGGLIVHWPQ